MNQQAAVRWYDPSNSQNLLLRSIVKLKQIQVPFWSANLSVKFLNS